MKRRTMAVALILLSAALVNCWKDKIVEWSPGFVAGNVSDKASGSPIDSATVLARSGPDSTDTPLGAETTDINGRYSMPAGFYEGNVYVLAQKEGFVPVMLEAYLKKHDTVAVDFQLERR